MLRVAINGFGRIGRAVFRINQERQVFQVVAINDIDPNVRNHSYLMQFDSTYGRFPGTIRIDETNSSIYVNEQSIRFYSNPDISKVPWDNENVDVIIDSSGSRENLMVSHKIIGNGLVRNIVVTNAPKTTIDRTVVFGVNESDFNHQTDKVLASSICDVNALAPVLKILDERYGIREGFITILHPWLSYQNLLDGLASSVSSSVHPWDDFSLARASTQNLIPKNTTLVPALEEVVPSITPCLEAMSFRVPTAIVSAADVTLRLNHSTQVQELYDLFQHKAINSDNIFGFADSQQVSIDFSGTNQSVHVDPRWIRVSPENSVKLVLWYDNEWGYGNRVVDLVQLIERENH